ncbi:MAG TPA: branched-chain amino acid ABC transporter permease, partial [Acidimicrobiia bacterium]|nr:branched-chain amino acid ABC transporter permease [Acidimicrobiia bacterium]
ALTVAGCFLPWATFFFGYPGKVTLAGFPGGARAYALALVAPALLSLVALPGRRAAATAGAGGVLAVTVGNLLGMANDGGGFGAVAYGAWVAAAGSALLLAAALSCPPDTAPALAERRLPGPAEAAAVAASLGLVLAGVWYGLDVDEPTLFASFIAAVAFAAAALAGLGVTGWLETLYQRHRAVTLTAAALAAVAFPFTQGGTAQWVRVFTYIGILAAAAIGLNVVVGLAGLLDLGYIAFFGVGAYVAALVSGAGVTTSDVVLPFWAALLLGSGVAAVFGVIIGAPTLRLRGDYLAIVTLAFGEIFRIVVNNWNSVTRGPNGLSRIPHLAAGGLNFGEGQKVLGFDLPHFANYYFLQLLVLAWVILVFTRINDSRIGRAWVAIREDEVAASAMGVNTVRLKLLAFAIGAFLAGTAGTVNAHFGTQVSPEQYTFLESVTLLAAVVLGGMGTVPGALIGSTALILIPEKLRAFQDPRLLLFGLALILMMRYRPEGIAPSRRRQRELHDTEGADALSAPPGSGL